MSPRMLPVCAVLAAALLASGGHARAQDAARVVLSTDRVTKGEAVDVTGTVLGELVDPVVSLVPVNVWTRQGQGKLVRQNVVSLREGRLRFRVQRVRPGAYSLFLQPDGRLSPPVIVEDALQVVGPRIVSVTPATAAAGDRVELAVEHLRRHRFRLYVGNRRVHGARRSGDVLRFRVPDGLLPGAHALELATRYDSGGAPTTLRVVAPAAVADAASSEPALVAPWFVKQSRIDSSRVYWDAFSTDLHVEVQASGEGAGDGERLSLRLDLPGAALVPWEGPTSVQPLRVRGDLGHDGVWGGARLYNPVDERCAVQVLELDPDRGTVRLALSGLLRQDASYSTQMVDARSLTLRGTSLALQADEPLVVPDYDALPLFSADGRAPAIDEALTSEDLLDFLKNRNGPAYAPGAGDYQLVTRFAKLRFDDVVLLPVLRPWGLLLYAPNEGAVLVEAQLTRGAAADPEQPDLSAIGPDQETRDELVTSPWIPLGVADGTGVPDGAFGPLPIPDDAPRGDPVACDVARDLTEGRGYGFLRIRVRMIARPEFQYDPLPYVDAVWVRTTAAEIERR